MPDRGVVGLEAGRRHGTSGHRHVRPARGQRARYRGDQARPVPAGAEGPALPGQGHDRPPHLQARAPPGEPAGPGRAATECWAANVGCRGVRPAQRGAPTRASDAPRRCRSRWRLAQRGGVDARVLRTASPSRPRRRNTPAVISSAPNNQKVEKAMKQLEKTLDTLVRSGVPAAKLLDGLSNSSKYGSDFTTMVRRREGRGEGAL